MTSTKDEIQRIKQSYDKRKREEKAPTSLIARYNSYVKRERESVYKCCLVNNFASIDSLKLLEIGAGTGDNILFFNQLGFRWSDLYANELLSEREEVLREKIPSATILGGNALEIDSKTNYDVIFQSIVFTSILSDSFKQKLASKMLTLLKQGGIILWYDFIYNNPSNKDVKGVGKEEIKVLFPQCTIDFFPVTLAPPIGRRIGSLYSLINTLFPFLRTHVVAVIKKK